MSVKTAEKLKIIFIIIKETTFVIIELLTALADLRSVPFFL